MVSTSFFSIFRVIISMDFVRFWEISYEFFDEISYKSLKRNIVSYNKRESHGRPRGWCGSEDTRKQRETISCKINMEPLCSRDQKDHFHFLSNVSCFKLTIFVKSCVHFNDWPCWKALSLWGRRLHFFHKCYWLQCSGKFTWRLTRFPLFL